MIHDFFSSVSIVMMEQGSTRRVPYPFVVVGRHLLAVQCNDLHSQDISTQLNTY